MTVIYFLFILNYLNIIFCGDIYAIVFSMPLQNLYENYDAIQQVGYTVQLFTDQVEADVMKQL